MTNSNRTTRFLLALVLALLAPWAGAQAQGYPTKPIQLVIPFPAGGATDVVGRSITLNGEPFTVVGVMARDFVFPVRDTDVAIPLAPEADPWRHNRESTSFLRLVGRTRDGVGRAAVKADLDKIAA